MNSPIGIKLTFNSGFFSSEWPAVKAARSSKEFNLWVVDAAVILAKRKELRA